MLFDRPAGAIASHADLKKWDVVWHVYGIWPPFVSGPGIIVRPPYADEDKGVVFDVRTPRRNYVETNFASDGNLLPDYSHNDNYWFHSEKEAEAARDWLRSKWEADPSRIQDEIERREERAREHCY
jgi:hypothetical protein